MKRCEDRCSAGRPPFPRQEFRGERAKFTNWSAWLVDCEGDFVGLAADDQKPDEGKEKRK